MRFWLSLVNVPEVDQYCEIARFAEEVGLRRAARNDGWFGVPQANDPLFETIHELHRLREERGASGP